MSRSVKPAKSLHVTAACPRCEQTTLNVVPPGTEPGSPYHEDLSAVGKRYVRDGLKETGDRVVDATSDVQAGDDDYKVVFETTCDNCGERFGVTLGQCRDLQWRALVMMGEASLEDEA